MYTEACSNQKIFENRFYMDFPLWAWMENIVYRVKTHWLSGKEKVLGTAVS